MNSLNRTTNVFSILFLLFFICLGCLFSVFLSLALCEIMKESWYLHRSHYS